MDKMLLAMAGLVLLTVVVVCGWLFLYTGDLPDVGHPIAVRAEH